MNDLRQGSLPLRSDEVVEEIDLAIAHYKKILSKGGWPQIPGNRMLRPGDDDERVPILRKRLSITGDLIRPKKVFDDINYDTSLEQAVVRFQERHGLRNTGRVDQTTLQALNITVEDRLKQLENNRNRITDLLRTPIEDRYVLVNIPAFQLEAVENYEVVQRHRIIAGRIGRETPVLKATIKAINFFPYWKVPESVAQLDVFPRLVREPEYLEKEKIRVFTGDFNGAEVDPSFVDWSKADATKIKLRQEPGLQNALGLVRIDMQNEHGVYMHDTPMKALFDQRSRAFSAGCVRVQNVFGLVSWLLRYEQGWDDPKSIDSVLQQGEALDIQLTRPVTVYFTYITAWSDGNGLVQFRPDIYNQDGQTLDNVSQAVDPDAPPPPAPGLAP
ncbi:MAG: murein L,D-transpeptidase [Hyphomicrobium sp.]